MTNLSSFGKRAAKVAAGAVHAMTALDQLKNSYGAAGSAAGIQTTKTLPAIIGAFIQQAMALLGVILVVLVIYAGFLWMTAQGNEEKIKKAKGIITSCVIGMIIIFAAYAITGFVVDALINASA
jgi:uncharacterized membrane protein YwzB